MEVLAGLLFLAALAGVVTAIVIAVQRGQDLSRFSTRLEDLEREVARLRRKVQSRAAAEEAPAPAVAAEEATEETEVLEALPAESPHPHPHTPGHSQRPDAATLEAWIGRQGF